MTGQAAPCRPCPKARGIRGWRSARGIKQVTSEVEKGATTHFVQYEGDWSGSIGAAPGRPLTQHVSDQ